MFQRTFMSLLLMSQLATGCILDESVEPDDLGQTEGELDLIIDPIDTVYIDWPDAHYPLDGNGIDIMGDADADAYGTTRYADRHGNWGKATWFNGTSAFMRVPYERSAPFDAAAMSLTLWFRPQTIPSDDNVYRTAFAALVHSNANVQIRLEECSGSNNGRVRFSYYTYRGWADLWSGCVIRERAWHHVAVTRDDEGNAALYIDGSLVSDRYDLGTPWVRFEEVLFGKNPRGHFFHGRLDELRVYDHPIHAGQVSGLANE